MYPTVTTGGTTTTQGDKIMRLMQAGVRVAAESPVVDTVRLVADRFSAAHAPVVVAF